MYKAIDLFAGAGGLSLGFKSTGRFELVAAAEINKNARATYKKNIPTNPNEFKFIENVVGCDFKELSHQLGGIEIVIGGPPCQGFSNANRQKNQLISSNNALVKEYFRAIKEIKPIAFVMENVSMLESDTHRFYDSENDHDEIEALRAEGFEIGTRKDDLFISQDDIDGFDMLEIANSIEAVDKLIIPEKLRSLLSVLNKNKNNEKRLPKFLDKNEKELKRRIEDYVQGINTEDAQLNILCEMLISIKEILKEREKIQSCTNLTAIVNLQKSLISIDEIYSNRLIGKYARNEENNVVFATSSYAVIDYINAILGDDYTQKGATLNAEWYGVPQERKRHIVIGVKKNNTDGKNIVFPKGRVIQQSYNVGDAIMDLVGYEVGYDKDSPPTEYNTDDEMSEYAREMRLGSTMLRNHITTSTKEEAMKRFKSIKQGENFHSLSSELKTTYSKPDRTQNTIYLRLNPNEPSGTVVNVRKSMWIHPTLDRAITVREAARLQSFPDDFEFIGTKDSQYQQVGNAVPPKLAEGIAKIILTLIEK